MLAEKSGNSLEFPGGVDLEILITNEKEAPMVLPRCYPAQYMVAPGPPLAIELPINEPRNELVQSVPLRNISGGQVMVIIGNGHIARIPYKIDHRLITWVEYLVTFQNATGAQPAQTTVGVEVDLRNTLLEIGKRDWIMGIDQISNEKPQPVVAGTGVRHDVDVIRINRKTSRGRLTPSDDSGYLRRLSYPPTQGRLSPRIAFERLYAHIHERSRVTKQRPAGVFALR